MTISKKYTVTILGQKYSLVSDEPEELIMRSAEIVNGLMADITQRATTVDNTKVAVLVSLKLARDYLAAQQIIQAHTSHYNHLVTVLDTALRTLSDSCQ